MSLIPQGLLLPNSTVNSVWFTVLATVVAFNTIIYVGLTASKFIPWPRQIHPSKVRAVHDAIFNPARNSKSRTPASLRTVLESSDPYDAMRDELAQREVPQAFAAFGGLMIIINVVEIFILDPEAPVQHLSELLTGIAFLVIAQVFGRRPFRTSTLIWSWMVGSLTLLLVLLIGVAIDGDTTTVALAMIFLTAFGSISLRWPPVLITTAVTVLGVAAVMFFVDSALAVRVVFLSMIAGATGMLLQSIRVSSIRRLSEEKQLYSSLATTDPLTGLLTRTGLLGLMPGTAANASRSGQRICLILIDIEDLSALNANYGFAYGDELLRVVADGIRSTVREGDLVSRWSGDDFLVAGPGELPDAISIQGRIEDYVRHSGIALGKSPVVIQVWCVSGDPAVTTFESMVAAVKPTTEA
jgi:diguanylate cyclase (GGDEF)-like protein